MYAQGRTKDIKSRKVGKGQRGRGKTTLKNRAVLNLMLFQKGTFHSCAQLGQQIAEALQD